MTDAYIYDSVRTPRGRGKQTGALHATKPVSLFTGLLDAVQHRNPDLDPSAIDDVVVGCVTPTGDQGFNNAAGRNMSPTNIELALKRASPLIGQACAIGDRRPYNVALLVLDPEATAGRSADDSEIRQEVAAAVQCANEQLSRIEQIKRYELLPDDWLPDSHELTPTMKLKRRGIVERYAAEIEALYT